MKSLVLLMTVMLAMAVVHSQRLSRPSQNNGKRTPATQKSEKKYIAEEVVVYLTPNQIKAIQEGKGFIDAVPTVEAVTSQENQEASDADQLEGDGVQLSPIESDPQVSQEEENQVASSIPVEKQNTKKIEDEPQFSWIYRTQKQRNSVDIPEELYRYLIDYSEIENQSEEGQSESEEVQAEPQEVQPESEEAQAESEEAQAESGEAQSESVEAEAEPEEVQDESEEVQNGSEDAQVESGENQEEAKEDLERNQPVIIQQQKYKLVPYESEPKRKNPSTTATPPTDRIRERWLRLLEQNRIQLRKTLSQQDQITTTTTPTTTTTTTTEQPQTTPETTLGRLRYSAKYRAQNKPNENKEQRGKNLLKKQKGVIRGQVQANNATNVARKELIKANQQKQKSVIKEVRVHTPVFIPIPESLEPKLARPSPVLLKGAKPVSAPGVKASVNDKKAGFSARASGGKPKAKSQKKISVAANNTSVIENRTLTNSSEEVAADTNSRQNGKPERITIIRHVFEN